MKRLAARAFGVLFLATLASVVGTASCDDGCKQKSCAEFDGSASVTFTKCYYGASPIRTVLKDEKGETFFDCTDGTTEFCTEDTVNAEYDYCYTHPGTGGAGGTGSGGSGSGASAGSGGTAQPDGGGGGPCPFENDGQCDEPGIGTGVCPAGSDPADCA